MTDLEDFQSYYRLADLLIEQASKEQVAECARLLALNLAHYKWLYGEVPLEGTLAIRMQCSILASKSMAICS